MLNRQVRPQSARQRQGFTLTELLVTIVIIAILIAILLPTVAAIRRSAYAAETRNTIAQISSAIQRYYQDHNAYPGVFANRDHMPSGNRWYVQGNGRVNHTETGNPITMSESLVLSLLGGLWVEPSGPTLEFDASRTLSARGPTSLNPKRPKQYTAYIPASDKILSPGLMSDAGIVGMNDSVVPEFVDAWPEGDKMPILYMRASAGASGIVSNDGSPDLYQYDIEYLEPYRRAIANGPIDGLAGLGDIDDEIAEKFASPTDTKRNNAVAYFKHPTLGGKDNDVGVPVEKDRYVLIAAGPDRLFGTRDDIRSWGD